MTSFGAENEIANGWTPSIYIQGQIHHWIGPLIPENNDPKYIQIYKNEYSQRFKT